MIPKWRMVRYTDEGCNLYQCLSCYKEWEGRDAPGWYDGYVATECLVEGGHQYTKDGKEHYYAKRGEPLYHPDWTHCPLCGVKWDGPVRCNLDNDRMLGERQKRNKEAFDGTLGHTPQPDYWYVVMHREQFVLDGEEPKNTAYYIAEKVHPSDATLREAWEHVKRLRKRSKEEEDSVPADYLGRNIEEWDLIIMKSDDLNRRGYISRRYNL